MLKNLHFWIDKNHQRIGRYLLMGGVAIIIAVWFSIATTNDNADNDRYCCIHQNTSIYSM